MPDSFEFTIADSAVDLDASRRGTVAIDVTSRLGRHARAGVEVQPADGADPSWFAPCEPSDFDLPDGGTLRTSVPIEVPPDVPAGEHAFAVRAYAIDDPQVDFTLSPSVVMSIPAAKESRGVPSWIFAVVIAAVLVVGGFIAWLVLRDGGGAESVAPDLVGLGVEDANATETDQLDVRVDYAAGTDRSNACVLYQAPDAGVSATSVAVLAVTCPEPDFNVVIPEFDASICGVDSPFCEAAESAFGDGAGGTGDFLSSATWIEASNGMVERFVEAFTLDGVPVPSVIGLEQADAIAALDDVGLRLSPIPDNSGGSPCVLLQTPYPGLAAEDGDEIRAITTRCPAAAESSDAVVLSTSIDTDGFIGFCDGAGVAFCNEIRSGPLGPDYLAGDQFVLDLAAQVSEFRNAFTGPTVPDVVGQSLPRAVELLDEKGLTAQYAIPAQPSGGDFLILRCWRVSAQNPGSGVRIDDVAGDVVALQLEEELCWIPPLIELSTVDLVVERDLSPLGE